MNNDNNQKSSIDKSSGRQFWAAINSFVPPGVWIIVGFVVYGIIIDVFLHDQSGVWSFKLPWFVVYPLAYIAWGRTSFFVYKNLRRANGDWVKDSRQLARHALAIAALFGLTKMAAEMLDNISAAFYLFSVFAAVFWSFLAARR